MISSMVRPRGVLLAWCLLALCQALRPAGSDGAGPAALAQSPATPGPKGLHIPHKRAVNFNHNMTDGGGFRWDIQYRGQVGSGTNNAYGNGLNLRISGSSYRPDNRRGWLNKAGDEVEIGPARRNNLRIYRRIKVYKDRPMARWLDIYENPTGQAVTISLDLHSYFSWPIQQTTTSSGAASFGPKDWAFITRSRVGHAPLVLHMVCGPRSKVRPTVRIENNQTYVRWSLTIPAKQTAILCYFESQNRSLDAHQKLMKSFRVSAALRDLPAAARRLIVNWSGGGFAALDLNRSDSADSVLAGGAEKLGKIINKSFDIEALFGPLKLPAERVVGMVAAEGGTQTVQFVLTDGQIVSAAMPKDKIHLELPTGGTLQIPFDRLKQWSFRVSDQRPDDSRFAGPTVLLRTGDSLLFDPDSVKLTLRSRYGTAPLPAGTLLRISLDNEDNAIHRVFFINGSHLGGFLEPRRLSLKLKLGPTLEVSRDLVARIVFAAEEQSDKDQTHATLSNDDELLGSLADQQIEVASQFGTIKVRPNRIKSMVFSQTHLGWAALDLWDGSKLSGRIVSEGFTFRIVPGPTLKIHPAQFVRIVCPRVLPPEEMVTKARKLIGRLGAESYQDRQAATEGLIKMGPSIAPILRQHLDDTDPEVRQRIEGILERFGAKGPAAGRTPPRPGIPGAMMRRGMGG